LESIEGNWTGRVIGEAMFGEAKVGAAQRIAAEMKFDLPQCYAYGDRANDRWLLAAVGRPVAVNPSRKLERLARKHGWEMMQWNEETNLTQRTQKARPTENAQSVNHVARRETRSGNLG
jgi:phosphoserine phosphatase